MTFLLHPEHSFPYDALAIDFNAVLFRINNVEPFDITIWRFFKSANKRVTVSRDVPIICAISSCVSASFRRGSTLFASPVFVLQSSSSLASFSAAECDKPSDRISWHAELYFSLNCSATRKHASAWSRRNRRKSSRFTKLTWHGSSVSAVSS